MTLVAAAVGGWLLWLAWKSWQDGDRMVTFGSAVLGVLVLVWAFFAYHPS